MSFAEAKWTVDQLVQKIALQPNDMRSFTAFSVSGTQIGLRFLEPLNSVDTQGNLLCQVEGVKIVMSEAGYPKNPNDGTLVIDNKNLGAYENTEFVVSELVKDRKYYFSAFPYSVQGAYNQYLHAGNKATAAPADGETAKVTITIDDPSEFTEVIVTCVNETDGSATRTATLTSSQKTASFVVPIGDTYHIEYGETKGYIAPPNTEPKVSVAGTLTEYAGAYSLVHIYGIKRDVTKQQTAWERTDDSIGKTAKASVGTSAGHSDFDNCYPWSGMKRETIQNFNVMVKIPKFWFKRFKEGNIEHIQICDKQIEGFALHPAFNHANIPKDSIYIGAYITSNGHKSKPNVAPLASQTRAQFRSGAKAKGTGWSLFDGSGLSALQMLYLVEFADNDSQKMIGRGWCDGNSGALNTGSCDKVPNLTGRPAGTDGKTGVVYRGIEDPWGNVRQWCDGVNKNDNVYWICNDPSKYADDTSTGYTQLSFECSGGGYIKEEGLDKGNNSHIMLPSNVTGGSETTYYCDYGYNSSGWRVFSFGGHWADGSDDGLFYSHLGAGSSTSSTIFGSRLLYIPS